MYPLEQNCNFQTEASFCASKSPKFPCILSCKAVFFSYKHNNELERLENKTIEKMSRLCLTPLRPRPPIQRLTHTPPLQPVTLIRSSSQSPANNGFLVFCSVDGWQTTIVEGLSHLWHILFTHFNPSIYLMVNKMSQNENEKKKRNSPKKFT